MAVRHIRSAAAPHPSVWVAYPCSEVPVNVRVVEQGFGQNLEKGPGVAYVRHTHGSWGWECKRDGGGLDVCGGQDRWSVLNGVRIGARVGV